MAIGESMETEAVFRALADRTRQRTLALLCRHELSVSELVLVLRQPQSTVSRHLKTLRGAGLIRDRRNGRMVLYSVRNSRSETDGTDLSGRLLDWIAEQRLAPALHARLDAIVQRRRQMSDRFFDHVGRRWDTVREEAFGTRFHLEAMWMLLPRDWTVVDVGTGTGYLLGTLAAYFKRVIGVDPVDTMLEVARQRVAADGLDNVALSGGGLSQLPMADASVDLAVAMLVLHHVPEPRDALLELSRVVRPGGRVLIVEQTAHENESFRERMQDRWWGFEPPELTAQVKDAGFEQARWHRLTAVDSAPDSPDLFVATGFRAESGSTESSS